MLRCAARASCGLLLVAPVPALAEGGVVDQVEKLDIEADEFELENQFIHARSGDDKLLQINTTFEYGVSDRLQFGVEVETARESGEAYALEEIGLQLKWAALDPEEAGFGLGLQTALVIDTQDGGIGSETFLIAEAMPEPFDLTANLVIGTDPGQWGDPDIAYALRGDRAISEAFAIGVEASGALRGEGSGSHFIGPVATFFPGEGLPAVELSAFAPLSHEAPALQLRLELDWVF